MSDGEISKPIVGSVRIAADRVIIREGGFFNELLRMCAKILVGGVLIIALLGLISLLFESDGPGLEEPVVLAGDVASANDILQIRLDGPILNHAPERGTGLFSLPDGFVYGYRVKRQLTEAADDETVRAVLLFVSTPGGQIAGSQAIHEGVMAVREAGKPIFAYIDGLSASGGVWATAGVDKIFADHGSVIGSVGVLGPSLFEYVDPVGFGGVFAGVETRGGIRLHTTTAGRGKDLGNPFRAPTPEEEFRLQAIVDEFYEDFVAHMEENRGIERARLLNEFGASLFPNEQAAEFGYIDGTSSYEETVEQIAQAAELGEDYRVIATPADDDTPFFLRLSAAVSDRAATADPRAEMTQMACAALRAEAVAMPGLYLSQICGR